MRDPDVDKTWDELNQALHDRDGSKARRAADGLLFPSENRMFVVDATWTPEELRERWQLNERQARLTRPLMDRLELINRHVERNWSQRAAIPGLHNQAQARTSAAKQEAAAPQQPRQSASRTAETGQPTHRAKKRSR